MWKGNGGGLNTQTPLSTPTATYNKYRAILSWKSIEKQFDSFKAIIIHIGIIYISLCTE